METQPLAHGDDSSRSGLGDSAAGRYHLVMTCADGSTRAFTLARPKAVIGRLSRCDVQVALPVVAEQHCELEDNSKGLILTDLGTEAGTFHNGNRVEMAVVRDGDRIAVGPIEFTVHDQQRKAESAAQTANPPPAASAEVVVVQQKQRPRTGA